MDQMNSTFIQKGLDSSSAKERMPGLWLYIAGFIVTCTGILAVNISLQDQTFTLAAIVMSATGYITSFLCRTYSVPLRALQFPALAAISVLIYALFSNSDAINLFIPAEVTGDHQLVVQAVVVWIAVLHSFTLSTDASVLFACVPAMTALSIVSVHEPVPAVRYDFMLFIAVSTFLMIHENYLRTLSAQREGLTFRTPVLFGAQILLALGCISFSLILGILLYFPVLKIGTKISQSVSAPGVFAQTASLLKHLSSSDQLSLQKRVALGQGPTTSTDTPLMSVHSSQGGFYWRGATYNQFSGHSFVKANDVSTTLYGEAETYSDGTQENNFIIPTGMDEVPPSDMKDSKTVIQYFTVLGDRIDSLFGAGDILRVRITNTRLFLDEYNSITTAGDLPVKSVYRIQSVVACTNPTILRQAPQSLSSVPFNIRNDCMQTVTDPASRKLALKICKGLTNNYDKAQAIKTYIASHCDYNLNAPACPADINAVDYFLFHSHQGYCDSFGAAMVMLCRYAGIPARMASGFITGDEKSQNVYTLRDRHLHIWAEVFFPGVGWVQFDATDGAKDITGQSQKKAERIPFLKWFSAHSNQMTVLIAILVVLLLVIIKNEVIDRIHFPLRNAKSPRGIPETNGKVVVLFLQIVHRMYQIGISWPKHLTPDEYISHLLMSMPALNEERDNLIALVELYNRSLYSRVVISDDDTVIAEKSAEALRLFLSKIKKNDIVLPAGNLRWN